MKTKTKPASRDKSDLAKSVALTASDRQHRYDAQEALARATVSVGSKSPIYTPFAGGVYCDIGIYRTERATELAAAQDWIERYAN